MEEQYVWELILIYSIFEQAAHLQWQYSGVEQLCFVWWTEMVGHQNKLVKVESWEW